MKSKILCDISCIHVCIYIYIYIYISPFFFKSKSKQSTLPIFLALPCKISPSEPPLRPHPLIHPSNHRHVLGLLAPHGHVAGDLLVPSHAPLADGHPGLRKDRLLLRELLLGRSCKIMRSLWYNIGIIIILV